MKGVTQAAEKSIFRPNIDWNIFLDFIVSITQTPVCSSDPYSVSITEAGGSARAGTHKQWSMNPDLNFIPFLNQDFWILDAKFTNITYRELRSTTLGYPGKASPSIDLLKILRVSSAK